MHISVLLFSLAVQTWNIHFDVVQRRKLNSIQLFFQRYSFPLTLLPCRSRIILKPITITFLESFQIFSFDQLWCFFVSLRTHFVPYFFLQIFILFMCTLNTRVVQFVATDSIHFIFLNIFPYLVHFSSLHAKFFTRILQCVRHTQCTQ